MLSLQSYVPTAEGGAQTRIHSNSQSVTDVRMLASPDFHFTVSSGRGRPQGAHAESFPSQIRVYSQDFDDGEDQPASSPQNYLEHVEVPSHTQSYDAGPITNHVSGSLPPR